MSLGSHETGKARAVNIKVEVTFAAAHTSSEGGLTRLSNFILQPAGGKRLGPRGAEDCG